MKFLVTRTPDALARARPPVRAFLAFSLLLLLAAAAQRAARGALAPAGVEALYAPAEGERWGSVAAWEALHAGAFLYGFLLLAVFSLLAVSTAGQRLRGWLLAVSTAGALLDLGAPLLPALHPGVPGWAALQIGGFAAATLGLLCASALAWAGFAPAGRRPDA